jgi:hypothetical protein
MTGLNFLRAIVKFSEKDNCKYFCFRTTTEEEKNIALVFILGFMLISVGACSFLTVVFVKAL